MNPEPAGFVDGRGIRKSAAIVFASFQYRYQKSVAASSGISCQPAPPRLIAYHLIERGQRTLLVEKNQPGQEASAAAGGILAVASGSSRRGPMYHLKRASQELYPPLIRELEERTGIDLEYQTVGVLELIRTDADEKKYRRLYELRQEQGYPVTWLSATEARRLEPALTADLRGAVHFSSDHHLHNGKLAEAWAKAAAQRGVTVQTGATVNEARIAGGKVTAVRVGDVDRISFRPGATVSVSAHLRDDAGMGDADAGRPPFL